MRAKTVAREGAHDCFGNAYQRLADGHEGSKRDTVQAAHDEHEPEVADAAHERSHGSPHEGAHDEDLPARP